MNILIIGFMILACFVILYAIYGQSWNTFEQNCWRVIKAAAGIIGVVICIAVVSGAILYATDGATTSKVYTPTRLICNGVTVAESEDGFSLNYRSGIYVDVVGNVSYTPKGGETCKEVKKDE